MINRDCPLTTAEECEQFLRDVGSKEITDGPEFMFVYNNHEDDPVYGNVSWIGNMWTTKECEVFILNISEI